MQKLHSYERTEHGFEERGVVAMGEASGCTTINDPSIAALAPNESWMLVDHFTGGPTGDSDGDDYAVFPINPTTHVAIQSDNFTSTLSQDFRWASFFLRPDSRTIIELEAADDSLPQRLHSWQVNEYGQVSEAPGSPVVMDIEEPSSYLLPVGPTNYIVGINGMLSEWAVAADGTLNKVGEIPDPTGTSNAGRGTFLLSTSSGRVIVLPGGNHPNQMDITTFMHDHPPMVKKTPFEYLIDQGNIVLFRPR